MKNSKSFPPIRCHLGDSFANFFENFANKRISPHFFLFFENAEKLELESSFKKVYLLSVGTTSIQFILVSPRKKGFLSSCNTSLSHSNVLVCSKIPNPGLKGDSRPRKMWVRNANIPSVHKFLIFSLSFSSAFFYSSSTQHSYHKFSTQSHLKI